MKKTFLPFMFALMCVCANAQETGMHFEHNTTWQKILAKAKAENKYIFVDCFTTWCGPCKTMSATIFPKKEVGDFFDANFVNVKLQLDTVPAKDNDEIKSWYAYGHEISVKYNVNAYPTYLIFNSNGELVHRFVGSMTADEFIGKGKDAATPEKQYYTRLRKYKAGEKNPDFLYNLAIATGDADDTANNREITNDYLATQTNLYTKTNLELIKKNTAHSTDKGFEMMLEQPQKVDSILGTKTSNQTIRMIIFTEEVTPELPNINSSAKPDWVAIKKKLLNKYLTMAQETVLFSRWFYYSMFHDWANLTMTINETMAMDKHILSPAEMNQFAWSIFQNSNDMTCIKSALSWSKSSFSDNNNYQFIDTYANLLMKAGKKQEAVDWETKAVAMAKERKDAAVGEYEETLNAMKERQNTAEATHQGDRENEPI